MNKRNLIITVLIPLMLWLGWCLILFLGPHRMFNSSVSRLETDTGSAIGMPAQRDVKNILKSLDQQLRRHFLILPLKNEDISRVVKLGTLTLLIYEWTSQDYEAWKRLATEDNEGTRAYLKMWFDLQVVKARSGSGTFSFVHAPDPAKVAKCALHCSEEQKACGSSRECLQAYLICREKCLL